MSFLKQAVQWVAPNLTPTTQCCAMQQRCMMLPLTWFISKQIWQLLLGVQETTPPQNIFLPAPNSSIISNHFPTLFRQEPTPFLFPHPCLKAWLTRIHAALCTAVNNKSIFTLCPSTCRTPSASEFHWFQCLLTGLIKVNHLWQTAFLHQMEQVIHCQSNRTRILQQQLFTNRNSLQEKKRV